MLTRARFCRARVVAEKGFLTVSWQAVKWSTTQVPPGLVKLAARAVLDVYAEAADEHGRQSYQSHVTVAWRLGCTVRNVSDHVESLRSAGLLVKSDDQSAVTHLPADTRPVVYDLPIHWRREDTLDDFREEERERRRRYRKPKTGSAEPSERHEENFLTGMQNSSYREPERHEENFHHGMKDSSPRHEENFPDGTKKTSDKPSLGTTPEPPLVFADAKPAKRRRKPQTTLPEDWKPNESHNRLARELGLSTAQARIELDNFRDNALAKDVRFRDWNAGFRTWLRNSIKFGLKPARGREPSAAPMADPRSGNLVEARW